MSVVLAPHVLNAMGFRESIPQGALVACFMSVTVYEARGVVVPEGFADAQTGRTAGSDYRIAVATGVNDGCRALTGDDFAESESEWCARVRSNGPFLLLGVGPTDYYECTAGHAKRLDDGFILTYNSFPEIAKVLGALEKRVVPPVLTAVICALNEVGPHVSLRKLERTSAGRCVDGQQVQDVRVSIKSDMFISQRLDGETLTEQLIAVTAKAKSLHKDAARMFGLGIVEDDQLKRFLFLFLAIEIETNRVFSRVDHCAEARSLFSGSKEVPAAAMTLIATRIKSVVTLVERFVWCATCVWANVDDKDVVVFKKLKVARDNIAHGRSSEAPTGYARLAELLAQKLLWR